MKKKKTERKCDFAEFQTDFYYELLKVIQTAVTEIHSEQMPRFNVTLGSNRLFSC